MEHLSKNTHLAAYLQREESKIVTEQLVDFCILNKIFLVTMHDGALCLPQDVHIITVKLQELLYKATGFEVGLDVEPLIKEEDNIPDPIEFILPLEIDISIDQDSFESITISIGTEDDGDIPIGTSNRYGISTHWEEGRRDIEREIGELIYNSPGSNLYYGGIRRIDDG